MESRPAPDIKPAKVAFQVIPTLLTTLHPQDHYQSIEITDVARIMHYYVAIRVSIRTSDKYTFITIQEYSCASLGRTIC